MEIDELPKVFALGENRSQQENFTPIELSRTQPDGIKLDMAASADYSLLLISMGFMTVWTVVVVWMSSDIRTVARHGILTVKNLHQVPCRNCRFFKNNPYLQCAVHPSTALTAEAIKCSDYCPQPEYR